MPETLTEFLVRRQTLSYRVKHPADGTVTFLCIGFLHWVSLHWVGPSEVAHRIHLLVLDSGKSDIIPRSMQLIAGRTAQEFNQRKKRNGAFSDTPSSTI
jgi:hypothetical protein